VVDIACVEADFQRKSQLIKTKTAVLNDKELELRMLEQQLLARERAISWQERQFDVKNSLQKVVAAPQEFETGNYYRNLENSDEKQTEKYCGQPNRQQQHHAFDHRQYVLPPDGDVKVNSSGWPMEKLEEQFARLAQPGTADVLARQVDIGRIQTHTQGSTDVKPRPPGLIPLDPGDQHFNTVNCQIGLTHEFTTGVRRRGRPRGSRNRCKMRMPSSEAALAVGGLPVYNQLIHKLYSHAQLLQRNPAAKEAVRRSLSQQMMVKCRPPGSAGMMTDSCQSTVKMFPGGLHVPNEQLRRESCSGAQLSPPPPPLLLTQDSLQSTALPSPRVQQLVASAAFTTGSSILPPLSPGPAAECSAPVSDNAEHDHIPRDSFQHGRSSGEAGKDVAYRMINDSAAGNPHPHNANPEKAIFIDRSARYPAEVHQQHLSSQVLSHNLMVTEYEGGSCNPVPMVVQSKREKNHILPKVSSFDTGHCWSSAQLKREDALHREREMSNYMSTVCHTGIDDDDDDDDDNRLVVVIDGD